VSGIKDRSLEKSFILVLGIDGAGKSTLVDALMRHAQPRRPRRPIRPTNGLFPHTVAEGNTVLTFWDISGHAEFRRAIWDNYIADATAVVYVVSARQGDRLHESRKTFDDVSMRFSGAVAVVFLGADREILYVFPSASRAARTFFVDLDAGDRGLAELYAWLKATAARRAQ